ncbi:hypothetical protein GIB67_024415 [Kingdonia uniflora]|uniref:BHLH domain-containing protein n=1 Tax=Kingdonia uniflora TaxID=39325 RepID=A0A7J7L4T9_9MAGN|nr:hypothetical protein GIB67_024415 [Kingdonia uniflora]
MEMDHWKAEGFCGAIQAANPSNRLQPPESSQKLEVEVKDSVVARKVQKADREKLRRDRLNEQFLDLGNTIDPDRPKNDKATILTDTIQILKDLTSQVNKLKAEYSTLSEESRELTQEKNELREEKVALKSDVDNLNVQYQQSLRVMFPWASMDSSVVMGPPSYPYPMPIPVPAGPIPMHPSLQPFPFFTNQNPGPIPNPCSTFIPYMSPGNLQIEHPSTQYGSQSPQPSGRSHTSNKQDSRNKSSGRQKTSNVDRCHDSNDVGTNLELKTPGSTTDQYALQESSFGDRKGQQKQNKETSVTDESLSSMCSSSRGDCSSISVGNDAKANH